MEDQAKAMEELIATLTKNYTWQIEMLINNTTEAMKEMMQLIKNDTKTPVLSNETKEEKEKKRNEKRKRFPIVNGKTQCASIAAHDSFVILRD